MNPNLSLDEIIRLNKNKNMKSNSINKRKARNAAKPQRNRKNGKKKGNLAGVKKSSKPSFKAKLLKSKGKRLPKIDARSKILGTKSNTEDARLKLLRKQNHGTLTKQNRGPIFTNKSSIADARQKIIARRKKKPQPEKRISGKTILAPDGIIQRQINVNNSLNDDVRVEYEDDLEFASLKNEDYKPAALLVRTIQNRPLKSSLKYISYNDDGMSYENSDGSTSSYRSDTDHSGIRFREVTRTFPNSNFKCSAPHRTSRRPSPVCPYSYEEDEEMLTARPLSPYHLLRISNLHEKVTGEDIKELFEDVGDLVYAKLIKNGVAEVAYKSEEDAMKAVEAYHNRQLDGLPMKCYLVSNKQDSYRKLPPPVNIFKQVDPDTKVIKAII